MKIAEQILLKKGFRSDAVWVSKWLYRKPFLYIPLLLDVWALNRSQYWPRARLDALSLERLHSITRDINAYPLWKERFEKSGVSPQTATLDDLAKLPILTKKDFLGRPLAEYTRANRLRFSYRDFTSGSTGSPLEHYFDFASELRSYAICERQFKTAGNGTRYPVVALRSHPRMGFALRKQYTFFVRGFTSIKFRIDDLVAFSKRLKRGLILYCYTSWLTELTRVVEEKDLHIPVRALIVTGEGLGPVQRTHVEKVFGAQLYNAYATRELGWLGFECPHRKIHINEEWAYVEAVDAQGKRIPYGTSGRIVVTTYDNHSMPFISYENGDIGTISDEPCPCGRTLRTIEFAGRALELIHVGEDRVVPLLDVFPVFDYHIHSVSQFQIVQYSPLDFLVRVVPASAYKANYLSMHADLIRRLHPKARIQWQIVEDIPRGPGGKALYFVRQNGT